MDGRYLIAGLGNPGRDYARTRHNAGFQLVDRLAEDGRAGWRTENRFHVRLAEAEWEGRRCLLCQPQTYMNCSGEAVGAVMGYFRIPRERLLVVADDADLPLGELRMRPRGGTGGHHGLASVEQHLGSSEYARLRLGIGRQPEGGREITDHVLGEFSPAEADLFTQTLARAAEASLCWLNVGIEAAMNRFNGPAIVEEQRKTE